MDKPDETEIRLFVIYVDLVGFTAFSQREDDRAAAELSWRFSTRAMQCGRRLGLRPIKTVGDGVILLASDATSACDGAAGLLRTLGPHSPLPLHVGIAGGEVIESEGDVFGYPVNLAAHLVSLAGPSAIFVDERTASAYRGVLSLSSGGTFEAREAASPVAIFEARLADPDRCSA